MDYTPAKRLLRPSRARLVRALTPSSNARSQLNVLWNSYLIGNLPYYPAPLLPLHLIHYTRLSLTLETFVPPGRRRAVPNLAMASSISGSIASYDPYHHCFVFHGELRLFTNVFLELANDLLRARNVESALVVRGVVRLPPEGVNSGYSRVQFEGRVVVVTCVLFLTGQGAAYMASPILPVVEPRLPVVELRIPEVQTIHPSPGGDPSPGSDPDDSDGHLSDSDSSTSSCDSSGEYQPSDSDEDDDDDYVEPPRRLAKKKQPRKTNANKVNAGETLA